MEKQYDHDKFEKMKSKYGNITATGEPGASSYYIEPNDEEFFHYVEPDIKPLVKLFIDHGLATTTSCQGHDYDDDYNWFEEPRSLYPSIKYLSNDLIDMVMFSAFDDIEVDNFETSLSEYNHIGYQSEFTIFTTRDREKIKRDLEIIRQRLHKAFIENESVIKEGISQGYRKRKVFDRINRILQEDQLFNPEDTELDENTRNKLIAHFRRKEMIFNLDGDNEIAAAGLESLLLCFARNEIKKIVKRLIDNGMFIMSYSQAFYCPDSTKQNLSVTKNGQMIQAHICFLANPQFGKVVDEMTISVPSMVFRKKGFREGYGEMYQITFEMKANKWSIKATIDKIIDVVKKNLLS